MAGYYLGIDAGTTLTKAVLCDENWHVIAKAAEAHKNCYPRPGWVEQDPVEIYESCLRATSKALSEIPGASAKDILALGLSNQGETCLVWEKGSGSPVYNAIVWQDRRTSEAADALRAKMGEKIRAISGLSPDAYYSATKLAWILDHIPDGWMRLERGELLMGTLNTYLFWRFTGGVCYKTDPSSAGCTMLMDLKAGEWSPELLDIFGFTTDELPEICDTTALYGYTEPECFLGARIPIFGSASDSPSSIVGGGCVGEGLLKTSYGTGSFMNFQTGEKIVIPENGMLSAALWRTGGKRRYCLRGACYAAGSAIDWLRDGLGVVSDVRETESIARSVEDSGGVYFVPALAGLGTPFWNQYARATFLGITLGTRREHMVRAVLESITYQVAYCYRMMKEAGGAESSSMRADGGIVENEFIMQLQADMLGIPVEIPEEKETAAFGAAVLAGVGSGALGSIEDATKFVKVTKFYEPKMSEDEREDRLRRWVDAVKRSLDWEE